MFPPLAFTTDIALLTEGVSLGLPSISMTLLAEGECPSPRLLLGN